MILATVNYNAIKLSSQSASSVEDALAVEHPLSVAVNGEAFTLTMQTPGDEADLVRGLLFTEGIIKKWKGELDFEITEVSEAGFVSKVNIVIPENQIDKSQLNKRNLLSVASCGICGKTELAEIKDTAVVSSEVLNFNSILEMFSLMNAAQSSFLKSGGSHAAAAFSSGNKMLQVKEDIGRHNAVDKVIGALLNNEQLREARFMLVSGRVSYEIVTKCFIAGIPFLLAVSAPSSLAVDFAKELGITLVGFCRQDRATVYSCPERLVNRMKSDYNQ